MASWTRGGKHLDFPSELSNSTFTGIFTGLPKPKKAPVLETTAFFSPKIERNQNM
jgi:hypothetical protein